MKIKILIVSLLISIGHLSLAQALKPGPNIDPKRDIDTNLTDRFVGKWRWTNKDTSIIFIFKREKVVFQNSLMGWYSFVVNGEVIINQLDKLNKLNASGLAGFVLKGNDSITFSMHDDTRYRLSRGTLSFVGKSNNQILLKYTSSRSDEFILGEKKVFEYKMPENLNIVLTRVE